MPTISPAATRKTYSAWPPLTAKVLHREHLSVLGWRQAGEPDLDLPPAHGGDEFVFCRPASCDLQHSPTVTQYRDDVSDRSYLGHAVRDEGDSDAFGAPAGYLFEQPSDHLFAQSRGRLVKNKNERQILHGFGNLNELSLRRRQLSYFYIGMYA